SSVVNVDGSIASLNVRRTPDTADELPSSAADVTRGPDVSVPPDAASALATLSRPPDATLPLRPATGSTLVRIREMTWLYVSEGFWPQTSAMAPVTCGVAIDVPLNDEYVLFGVVLRMPTPGAARSTVVAP